MTSSCCFRCGIPGPSDDIYISDCIRVTASTPLSTSTSGAGGGTNSVSASSSSNNSTIGFFNLVTHSEPSAHYIHIGALKAIVRQFYTVAKIETAPAINAIANSVVLMQNLLFDKLSWVLESSDAQCVALEMVTVHKDAAFVTDSSGGVAEAADEAGVPLLEQLLQPLQQPVPSGQPAAAAWNRCTADFEI